jgi:hypothetical protein
MNTCSVRFIHLTNLEHPEEGHVLLSKHVAGVNKLFSATSLNWVNVCVCVYMHRAHMENSDEFAKQCNPITGLDRPWGFQGGWGSQVLRQSAHEGGKVVSRTHRPALHTRKYSWYSFLLEVGSTPGPLCGRKDYVNEKFQWHHRESIPRPSGL